MPHESPERGVGVGIENSEQFPALGKWWYHFQAKPQKPFVFGPSRAAELGIDSVVLRFAR